MAAHLSLAGPSGNEGAARATVSVNALGPLDLLQVAVTGLKPGEQYALWLVSSRVAPFGKKESLATFKANAAGAQIAQTIGPLREVLTGTSRDTVGEVKQRFLLITRTGSTSVEMIQTDDHR